jgi:putative transposase
MRIGPGVHVTARGNRQAPIFLDSEDRFLFLSLLGRATMKAGWTCTSYCLMGNHFHLVLEEIDELSRGMHALNGVYAQYFNARHGFAGHLFEARFNSEPIENDGHHLEVARYVVLNPVRAGITRRSAAWPWSSYRATVGTAEAPAWLGTRRLLELFDADEGRARARYAGFVREGARRQTRPRESWPGRRSMAA